MGSTALLGAQATSGSESAPDRQEAGRATTGRSATSQKTRAQSQEITAVGCLMPGDQNGAVGTSGSAASTAPATSTAHQTISTFILSNATTNSGASDSPARTTAGINDTGDAHGTGVAGGVGTSGVNDSISGSTSSDSGSYALQGSDLTSFLGQRVEVKGMLMPAAARTARRSSSSAGHASSSGTAASAGTIDANADMPHVRVTSVRMIALDCSGAPDRQAAPDSGGNNR